MIDKAEPLVATDHILVELTFRLGRTRLTVAQLSALGPEDVLTLDQDISDGVDICVGDRVIARGELVADGQDDRLCVRLTGPADAA